MAIKDVDVTVLKSALNKVAEVPELQAVLEQMAGAPILLESRDGRRAIPLDSLVDLLPQIGKFLPIILSLFTGGFSPALILQVIKILAELFGVSEESARAMMRTSLQLEGQP